MQLNLYISGCFPINIQLQNKIDFPQNRQWKREKSIEKSQNQHNSCEWSNYFRGRESKGEIWAVSTKIQWILESCLWYFRKLLQVKKKCLSSKNISIVCGMCMMNQPKTRFIRIFPFPDESDRFEGTFRRAIWPFLVISQLYGVMPVAGVSSWSLSDLQFKWKSSRTIYAIIVALILSGYSLYLLWKIFTTIAYFNIIGLEFSKLTWNPRLTNSQYVLTLLVDFSANFLFYAMNALEFIGFMALSLQWAELMQSWQMTESLPVFQNCTCNYKTAYMRRIRFIASVALILALGISRNNFQWK